ncbi:MAG: VanZ family protein [Roseburia sp.]
MRISDIVSLAKDYMILGIVVVAFCAVIYFVGYGLIYRKIGKGKKKPSKMMLLWGAIFLGYLVIVFGGTMLNRSASWENREIMPLFYSYKEAWSSWSVTEWRNIILNILLFIPLGFLLPLGIKRFRKFWKTYLAGFGLTLFIEVTQLLLKRGIFELDDIFDNLLGTMIGYGIFAICVYVRAWWKKEKKSLKKTLALQIPLAAAIIIFSTIFASYVNQELGNFVSGYIIPYDTDLLEINTVEQYETKETTAVVYQVEVMEEEQTKEKAASFLKKTGTSLDESRTDLYEDTAVYYGEDGNTFWIDYVGGTYSYTDFSVLFSEDAVLEKEDASEAEIREALKNYGIEMPQDAVFENQGEGNYLFTVSGDVEGNRMYDGTLSCSYFENGKIGEIRNKLLCCEKYKEFSIISEEAAYQQICEGKFRHYGKECLKIRLGDVRLGYQIDSKGFYQPVYCFEAEINKEKTELMIPAIP